MLYMTNGTFFTLPLRSLVSQTVQNLLIKLLVILKFIVVNINETRSWHHGVIKPYYSMVGTLERSVLECTE